MVKDRKKAFKGKKLDYVKSAILDHLNKEPGVYAGNLKYWLETRGGFSSDEIYEGLMELDDENKVHIEDSCIFKVKESVSYKLKGKKPKKSKSNFIDGDGIERGETATLAGFMKNVS